VLIYHGPSPDRLLTVRDTLDGEDVVPEFSCPVTDLSIDWGIDDMDTSRRL
jgi:hypothetical protein